MLLATAGVFATELAEPVVRGSYSASLIGTFPSFSFNFLRLSLHIFPSWGRFTGQGLCKNIILESIVTCC